MEAGARVSAVRARVGLFTSRFELGKQPDGIPPRRSMGALTLERPFFGPLILQSETGCGPAFRRRRPRGSSISRN